MRCRSAVERVSARSWARFQSSMRRKAAPAPAKGVVGKGETDAGGGELAGQPAMPIAIELQTERAPGRHPQIDQAQLGVDEVEIAWRHDRGHEDRADRPAGIVTETLAGAADVGR